MAACKRVLIAMGVQRSGNHAVLMWVRSLFSNAAFLNDCRHDFFADMSKAWETITALSAETVVLSFEDSRDKMADPTRPLLDSVVLPPPGVWGDAAIVRLIIQRDPYNTWASRVAANRHQDPKRHLTSLPDFDLFRQNWLALAGLADAPEGAALPTHLVPFNRWRSDRAFRKSLCRRLGGTYSEATLNMVARQGSGSSFDGVARPSYGQIIGRLGFYLSPTFLRRLIRAPGSYVRRLVRPPLKASDLAVDERWRTLADAPEAKRLFSDPALKQATERIFGSYAPDLEAPGS